MSREQSKKTRRTVLKQIGAVAGTLLAGTGAVSSSEPTTADFDPYSFQEVDQYLNDRLVRPDGSLKKPKGGTITVDNSLNREQVEAAIHAMTPRVSVNSTTTAFETEGASTQTEITVYGEDPTERWGWETPSHITESVDTDRNHFEREINTPPGGGGGGGGGGVSSATFNNTQRVAAFSILQPAWKWECGVEWEYDGAEVLNTYQYDIVKDTHHDITHQSTDTEEKSALDDEVYQVFFQANFSNLLPTVTIDTPFGSATFDLSSTFEPWQELKGDKSGNGEVVGKEEDTAWYWKF